MRKSRLLLVEVDGDLRRRGALGLRGGSATVGRAGASTVRAREGGEQGQKGAADRRRGGMRPMSS
ncbi:MAG: hypothetical protein IPL60_17755 [Ardenticatenia bacterium]|nr:hypothetical protein [Ardenticatenia bacterium]